MRTMVLIITTMVLTHIAAGQDTGPIPQVPEEIELVNGAVLRKCEVLRWQKHDMVIKHAGGVAPVRYDAIAEPHRSQIEEYRKEMRKPISQRRAAATYKGQVFVTTAGAGAYKFSNATVFAFDARLWENLKSAQRTALNVEHRRSYGVRRDLFEFDAWMTAIKDVKPVAIATTDADGRFELKLLVDKPIFVFCQAGRLMAGGGEEINLWAMLVDQGEQVVLSSENKWVQPD